MSIARSLHLAICTAATLLCAGCADRGSNAVRVVDEDTPRDLARVVERLMPALERISGLDRIEEIHVRRQSREDARRYVIERLEQEMPPAEREALRRTYVALGLLPDTLDLDSLLIDLYTEQVLGYYAPTRETLFVVEGVDVDEIQVIAHELVHALQDQHANLDSLVAAERGNDRRSAAHAAIEGHAMLVTTILLAERATGSEIDAARVPPPSTDQGDTVSAPEGEYPVFARAPRIVRETLLFPYIDGAAFVHAIWNALRPLPRYPAPLDSLLPQSTEQVMEPVEHFIRERDEPVPIALAAPPAGWRLVRDDGLGQLEIEIFLAQHLGDDARAAADGWEGDRYALLENADGSAVVDWWSIWQTPAHADRFADAVRRTAPRRPARSITVVRTEIDGRAAVHVVDAPRDVGVASLAGG